MVYNGRRSKVDSAMLPGMSLTLTPTLIATHHHNTGKPTGRRTACDAAWQGMMWVERVAFRSGRNSAENAMELACLRG